MRLWFVWSLTILPHFQERFTILFFQKLGKWCNTFLNKVLTRDYYEKLYFISVTNLLLGFTVEKIVNAANFYAHFLNNTGADYIFDASDIIENTNSGKINYDNNIKNIITFCENTTIDELYFITNPAKDITGTTYTTDHRNGVEMSHFEKDWWHCVGDSSASVSVKCLKDGDKYTAYVTYSIIDYYDFKPKSKDRAGLVNDGEMHSLHLAGMAREYKVIGTYNKKIKWYGGSESYEISDEII